MSSAKDNIGTCVDFLRYTTTWHYRRNPGRRVFVLFVLGRSYIEEAFSLWLEKVAGQENLPAGFMFMMNFLVWKVSAA